ncbi:hypothetical protein LINPERHAP1_LOCUS32617 [Linum perenne]
MDLSSMIPIRRLMASSLRMSRVKLWTEKPAGFYARLLLCRKPELFSKQ